MKTLPKYPFQHEATVLVEGHLAVLVNNQGAHCGYTSIPADEVPREWHGNYDADGLQYLSIHGGITYCDVGGGDEEARARAERAARDAFIVPEGGSLDERLKAYSARRVAVELAGRLVPYDYVTFGFDCGHFGDEERSELRDQDYVLTLCKQMNAQLRAFALRYEEYKALPTADAKIALVQEIRDAGGLKTELGLGGMIAIMRDAGK